MRYKNSYPSQQLAVLALLLVSLPLSAKENIRIQQEKFISAVERGDCKVMEEILKKDPKLLNTQDTDRKSFERLNAAELSIVRGKTEALESLLRHGAKLQAGSTSLLHLAARNGRTEIAELLLRKGAKADLADGDGLTPLAVALMNRQLETAKSLVSKGVAIDPVSACGLGRLDILKKTTLNLSNRSPELQEKGHHVILPYLHCAAANNQAETVDYLLAIRVPADSEFPVGSTALYYAVLAQSLPCVKLLVAHGAKVHSSPTIYGSNDPFSTICKYHSDLIIVTYLLDHHAANVNMPLDNDQNVLHIACDNKDEKLAQLLVERAIDINKRRLGRGSGINGCIGPQDFSDTPLHIAAREGSFNIVKLLVEHNARLSEMDDYGFSPIDYAIKKNHKEIVEYLRSKGAKPGTGKLNLPSFNN